MGEASAHLVDGLRGKDVGISSNRLIGLGGLNALLKGAPVRDAAEDARNVDGIVGVAESYKHLVRLAGIHVAADIKLISVLVQIGADAIDLGFRSWEPERG